MSTNSANKKNGLNILTFRPPLYQSAITLSRVIYNIGTGCRYIINSGWIIG